MLRKGLKMKLGKRPRKISRKGLKRRPGERTRKRLKRKQTFQTQMISWLKIIVLQLSNSYFKMEPILMQRTKMVGIHYTGLFGLEKLKLSES